MEFSIHFTLAACFVTAAAQAQLIVSTGTPEGTYGALFRELNSECAADYKLVLTEWRSAEGKVSNGSVLNLDNLINNRANIAFSQMDVMRARAHSDERVNSLRIVFPLYDAEVHFLASKRGKKEGGVFGIGAKTSVFRTVSDFRGRTVGAWGGSIVTAAYINQNDEAGRNHRQPCQVGQCRAGTKGRVAVFSGWQCRREGQVNQAQIASQQLISSPSHKASLSLTKSQ